MKKIFLVGLVFAVGCSEPLSIDEDVNPNIPPEMEDEYQLTVQDFGAYDEDFHFRAQVPDYYQVEYVSGTDAISVFDPNMTGVSDLDKSIIFIRYFRADRFLTLNSVDILSREEKVIHDRDAVTYEIQKKTSVPDFADQPSWRNERHFVTDIRMDDSNTSYFYVFAKRPDLDQEIYDDFIESLYFGDYDAMFIEPIDEFYERITKKSFGLKVDPSDSPVQPERFSGYHTGVDVEYDDVDGEVDVVSINDGKVVFKDWVSGYGGVVMIEHSDMTALYGHLDIDSVEFEVGDQIYKRDKIGVLGEGYSGETDGERKHLHFGLLNGSSRVLAGYVQSEAELAKWIDPLAFY